MAAAVSGASQRGAARAARPAPRRTGQRRGPSSGGHRPAAAPPPRPPRPPPPPGLQTQLPLLGYGRCGNAGQGVQIPRASVPSAGPFRRPSAPPGRDRCLRFSGRALGSQSSSSSGRLSSAGSPILVRRRPEPSRPQVPPPAPPGAPHRGGEERRARALGLQSSSSRWRARNKRGGGAGHPAKLVGGGGAARVGRLRLLSPWKPAFAHPEWSQPTFLFRGRTVDVRASWRARWAWGRPRSYLVPVQFVWL